MEDLNKIFNQFASWIGYDMKADLPPALQELWGSMNEGNQQRIQTFFTSMNRNGGGEGAPDLFGQISEMDGQTRRQLLETLAGTNPAQLETLFAALDNEETFAAIETLLTDDKAFATFSDFMSKTADERALLLEQAGNIDTDQIARLTGALAGNEAALASLKGEAGSEIVQVLKGMGPYGREQLAEMPETIPPETMGSIAALVDDHASFNKVQSFLNGNNPLLSGLSGLPEGQRLQAAGFIAGMTPEMITALDDILKQDAETSFGWKGLAEWHLGEGEERVDKILDIMEGEGGAGLASALGLDASVFEGGEALKAHAREHMGEGGEMTPEMRESLRNTLLTIQSMESTEIDGLKETAESLGRMGAPEQRAEMISTLAGMTQGERQALSGHLTRLASLDDNARAGFVGAYGALAGMDKDARVQVLEFVSGLEDDAQRDALIDQLANPEAAQELGGALAALNGMDDQTRSQLFATVDEMGLAEMDEAGRAQLLEQLKTLKDFDADARKNIAGFAEMLQGLDGEGQQEAFIGWAAGLTEEDTAEISEFAQNPMGNVLSGMFNHLTQSAQGAGISSLLLGIVGAVFTGLATGDGNTGIAFGAVAALACFGVMAMMSGQDGEPGWGQEMMESLGNTFGIQMPSPAPAA